MATSTRSPPVYSTNEQPFRRPLKKTSFLSLKREKRTADGQSNPSPPQSSQGNRSRAGSSNTSPSSFHAFQVESPEPLVIGGPYKLKEYRPRSNSKSLPSVKDSRNSSKGKDRSRLVKPAASDDQPRFAQAEQESIPWPAMDADELEARVRTSSGPSEYRVPFARPLKYPYRDSGSSTLSHFDPLPQTPIDDFSFREPVFTAPHVVAAPISGVETMDALVDGMNGSSDEDHYNPFPKLSSPSRAKSKQAGHHHPLYHPPLPTPPPGVTLGGALPRKARRHSGSDSEGGYSQPASSKHRRAHDKHPSRPQQPRSSSGNTITTRYPVFTMPKMTTSSSVGSFSSRDDRSISISSSTEEIPRHFEATSAPPKVVAPSISEIIRAHAPASQQVRSRPATADTVLQFKPNSISRQILPEDSPSDSAGNDEDADLVSRSSVDTIADEVRRTIRNQAISPVSSTRPQVVRSVTGPRPHSSGTEYTRSPMTDSRRNSSLFSDTSVPPLDLTNLTKPPTWSTSQAIAQYLRSSRLTTVLRLTRGPHASREAPLSVSFSDLGSSSGFPLVVFLGLGCVRHIMGLYDEMADLMGLRLITIDRWGLGRTGSPRNKFSSGGIPEWATVVEEVLDHLSIDQCSIMAHSAGAPYALAFANRFPERVRGDVCLLAPWVGGGEGAGYKWLKYVPNGILKTAQAAEWKVQAWMLGKPPSLAYEGIGFELEQSTSPISPRMEATNSSSSQDVERRSDGSSGFSDYDDLKDFDGRFESRSTLGRNSVCSGRTRTLSESKGSQTIIGKKTSKGFLGRFRNGNPQPTSPTHSERPSSSGPGKRLKALRSMGSLKGRSSSAATQPLKKSTSPVRSAWLPPTQASELGLGLDNLDWDATIKVASPVSKTKSIKSMGGQSFDYSAESSPRSSGRRSVSFGAKTCKSIRSMPPVPPLPSVPPSPCSPRSEPPPTPGPSYQVALGNALIAASHAESSKGTHSDLLQILNHDRQPWGFSYSAYPHTVRVWYGDRDERIALNAVRWMENTMGRDKCQVQVVKNADHALMFNSGVVIEVLEYIAGCWRPD
ncbi:hypothetical protein PHLGIDRAFT_124132 [Phlebiopsis gigantea 11061_1 CR5-6]|uniref:AB hydrolase-1 domain-containing protein n=1 Tax=Phlebiopsis gigantea (strain 11061_1 CR5-6) TaxID=745531 RepID=A0A0C3PX31_PHLG1|nr:hypothetical protein PHLGIDRAFT_124132 [Phlebiopsis gigantea 11061_1 CR5-6]